MSSETAAQSVTRADAQSTPVTRCWCSLANTPRLSHTLWINDACRQQGRVKGVLANHEQAFERLLSVPGLHWAKMVV